MIEPKLEALPRILQAVGLGHRFPDGVWAFRGIDLSIGPGEIAVLAGRNGAGKTYLAKHLAGLLEPTEGSVLVSGQDIRKLGRNPAEAVGYVFQDARLQAVGETVLEDSLFGPGNLGLDPAESMERALGALSACGLSEKADCFVHRLSGGELRRLAIAGVLAMRPKAVILDEPFANLDLGGVRSILAVIAEMSGRGMAVLVVTHEIEKVLGLAASFAVMDGGSIVLSGEPAEVLAKGIEAYGLRDPFRLISGVEGLSWLD